MAQFAQALRSAIRELVVGASVSGSDQDVLVGLIGRGIQSSRSPAMHEREAARHGLRCACVLIDFDALGLADADLAAVVDAARSLGFNGVKVTHPFKQAVVPLLGDLSQDAAAIGAVNTVVFWDGAVGDNTDCWGFSESFRGGMRDAAVRSVAQFGAGGAGAAVAYALLTLGVGELVLVDSDTARTDALAAHLRRVCNGNVRASRDLTETVQAADGLSLQQGGMP